MPQRRFIEFGDWQAVIADLENLRAGYTAVGKWDLEQTARHLNDWLRFPMDGYPQQSPAMRMMLAVLRSTVGRGMLRKIIAEGKMQAGGPTIPATVYESGDSAACEQALEELTANIRRFEEFNGTLYRSPLFGDMDKKTSEQLQLVHFAHHLSFLVPNSDQRAAESSDAEPPDAEQLA